MRKLLTMVLLLTLWNCQSVSQDPMKKVELITPYGKAIKTTLAITEADQNQGLSGVRPDEFSDDQGMLFFYMEDFEKHFWMPDTYFDLDLFYLDQNLRITEIIRKAPHYIGRANPHLIPRLRGVWCRHVLEMKSSSDIAQKLKVGDQLKWKSSLTLEETTIRAKKLN